MSDRLREQVEEMVEKGTNEMFEAIATQFQVKGYDFSPKMTEEMGRYREYLTNLAYSFVIFNEGKESE